MPSYVERLEKIKNALEETASNIEERGTHATDEQLERAEVYETAAEAIAEAIDALEGL